MEKLRFWYNGYQFTEADAEHPQESLKVYNPFSVLLCLSNGKFFNYWFDTGTPSFLMQLIKSQEYPISQIEGSEVNRDETKFYDVDKIKLIPLLWQTGYLTIESYDPLTHNYRLVFPNEEVRVSFLQHFISYLTERDIAVFSSTVVKLSQALQKNNLPLFFETLQIFFAQIPYTMQLPLEKYYQSIFYVILSLIGAYIQAEVATNDGRIDAIIETDSSIYVLEFKLDESAESALAQIETKKYYQKYLQRGKKITLIGVQFSTEKRNLEKWFMKEL